jgi:hypothetical protein
VLERAKTVHALDRAATAIGYVVFEVENVALGQVFLQQFRFPYHLLSVTGEVE